MAELSTIRWSNESPRAYLDRCGARSIEVTEIGEGWQVAAEVANVEGGHLCARRSTLAAAWERAAEQLELMLTMQTRDEI